MKLLTELGDEQCLVQMHRAEMAALVVLGALSNSLGESRPAPMAAQPEPGTDKAVKFAAEMPPLAKHVVVTCGKQKVRAKPRPLANGTRAARRRYCPVCTDKRRKTSVRDSQRKHRQNDAGMSTVKPKTPPEFLGNSGCFLGRNEKPYPYSGTPHQRGLTVDTTSPAGDAVRLQHNHHLTAPSVGAEAPAGGGLTPGGCA